MSAVAWALHYLRPPSQDLSFLAKLLMQGTLSGDECEHAIGVREARVLLGTPLFVQQIHPMRDEDRWGLDEEWSK